MAVLTESWVTDTSLLLILLLPLLYRYFSTVYFYFRNKGIPYLKPIPLLGHKFMHNMSQTDIARFLYNSFPDERFFGFFQMTDPVLLVKDPDLIHQVMVKDFTHFHDRGFATIEGDFLQTMSLFSLKGHTWRTLRNKLSPTFSSGKLKFMFSQFKTSGDHLLDSIAKDSGQLFDAKLLAVDFTSEVIASVAFGIDFSKDNPQSMEFVSHVTSAFKRSRLYFSVIMFFITFAPKLLKWLGMTFARPGTAEYFVQLTKATKEYRRENRVKRNDYFDLLLELQRAEESGQVLSPPVHEEEEEGEGEDKITDQMEYAPEDSTARANTKLLTDEVLTAQAFVFLLAGSETVSATLSFALYHIAKDPSIQRKLHLEVDTALAKHGGFTYQSVKEMTYMDQVLQEVLRFYPPLPTTLRQCTVPYEIPGTTIVLERGAKVSIPVAGLHMDPKYYPEPHVFRPERFVDNNHKPSPTYMPFGDGPRICIAMRFALVEMKVFLAKILSQYHVEVDSRTQEPLVLDKVSFGPLAAGGIWINMQQRG